MASSHGGAKDLEYMRAHEFEGAMFGMKSSMMRTIWGGGQFVGGRYLYSSMK